MALDCLGTLLVVLAHCFAATHGRNPNIILILADDMGYGDLSSYGHPTQEAGAVDRLAAEGARFTQTYTAATFCSPSRAALLTGRLPVRMGVHGDVPVYLPFSSNGLPKSEITLAESLKEAGYATGITGKWHLGINEHHFGDGRHLPHHHGFDYVGRILPFTVIPECDENKTPPPPIQRDFCVLYDGDRIVQQPLTLSNLTDGIVEDAKAFIYNNSHQPFFLYFSLPQPHAPPFASRTFVGSSRRGAYGDMMNEMSWAVGQLMWTLEQLQLQSDTLVLFMSDHGPHKEMCHHSGDAGPLSGGKGNYFEGGLRVPMIAWWPGTIAAGQVKAEVVSTLDIYPTLLDIVGIPPQQDRHYDGVSIKHLLLQKPSEKILWDMNHIFSQDFRDSLQNNKAMLNDTNSESVQKVSLTQKSARILFFHYGAIMMAVRYKNYKVHFRIYETFGSSEDIQHNCVDGIPVRDYYKGTYAVADLLQEPLIYNVESDPGEQLPYSVVSHRELLAEIEGLVHTHMQSIPVDTPRLLDRQYYSSRLLPCCNPPYCHCR